MNTILLILGILGIIGFIIEVVLLSAFAVGIGIMVFELLRDRRKR